MTLALSTTISVAGCGTDADRLAAAGGRKAEAGVVDNALDLARAEIARVEHGSAEVSEGEGD